MKECSLCKGVKEKEDFHKKTRSKDGLSPNCKECEKTRKSTADAIKQRAERYKKNKKHIIAVNAEFRKKNWKKYQVKHKEYYQKNKAKWLEAGWKQKGILNEEGKFFTLEDFKRILASQDNVCKICNGDGKNHGKGLTVDHDHKTGIVRGILCGFCNTAIAYLQEDVLLLSEAITYLKMTMK